ncbi:MAG: flagellar protein FlgN [Granulosicoccus sp.]|nr:flagellar protein FlgN [Granulosicoccus sp.]
MEDHGKVIETPTELVSVLNDFTAVLELEQEALLAPASEHLDTVVTRKHALLQQINQIHPSLIQKMSQPEGNGDDLQQMVRAKELINTCNQHNRENGALVAQNLKIFRSSISFLSRNMNQHAVELYNPYGETHSELRNRDIGKA